MHPYGHCSIVHNSQDTEATQVPINNRQGDKKAVAHIFNGILFSHKKNEILSFATAWIDLEGIMLSEISQRKTNTL